MSVYACVRACVNPCSDVYIEAAAHQGRVRRIEARRHDVNENERNTVLTHVPPRRVRGVGVVEIVEQPPNHDKSQAIEGDATTHAHEGSGDI